jgi:hypothetical protein
VNASQSVTVHFATANGSALSGSDYVAQNGTLTFNPGIATQPISVTVNGDTAVEPNETFFVNLTSPANATIGDAQGQGTITNDDGPGGPSVAASPATVAPGATITGTVTGGPGNALDWVGLYCPATLADGAYVTWRYLNNLQSPPASSLVNATVTFPAPNNPGATCNLRLFSNDGFTKLATSATITIAGLSSPSMTASPATVAPGGTITGTVSNGPANARDWVGLYCPTTLGNTSYLDWRYLNNTKTPPGSGVANATVTLTAPNNPGSNCNLRLFADDGYTKLATSATVAIQ